MKGFEERIKEAFSERIEPVTETGCWLWTGRVDSYGYGMFNLGTRRLQDKAHIISYLLWVGPIPAGLCVLHRCDIPACVNPKHLWLGTKADNSLDMFSKGRKKGKMLKPEEVKDLREMYKTGLYSQRSLAAKFGMSQQGVCDIVNFRHRKEV